MSFNTSQMCSTPLLPQHRVSCDFPFRYVGVRYMFEIIIQNLQNYLNYIYFYLLALLHDVHIWNLILTIRTFIFRRGKPYFFISDNFKTFISKSLKHFLLKVDILWKNTLEKSPWRGDFYERIIGIIKTYLKRLF